MFAGQQTGLRHRKVRLDRSSDDDCVQARPIEHMRKIHLSFDFRIQSLEVAQALFAQVAHYVEVAVRQCPEIPNQIRPPVTTPDYSNLDLFGHKSSTPDDF